MSPWVEISVTAYAFWSGLFDKFHGGDEQIQELVELRKFKQRHMLNSQYYH